MHLTVRRIVFLIALLAAPGAALADAAPDLRVHRAPVVPPQHSGAARPSGTVVLDRAVIPPAPRVAPRMKRLLARRDRTPTCVRDLGPCRGAGIDWTGNLILLDLDANRDVVVTGWGARLDDGVSMSAQIVTIGIRQPLVGRLWIQGGGGYAKGRMTFADRGRYDSRGEMVPAVSASVGLDVTSTTDLDVDFAVTAATAVSELDHVEELRAVAIYNVNVGFTGRFR